MSNSTGAQVITHAVGYDQQGDAGPNADFQGQGRLTVHPEGPTYTFTGRARGLFSRRQKEMTFRPEEITNVGLIDRSIVFKTPLGASGRSRRQFVFHLKDAAEAHSVATLLPKTVDEEFLATQDFHARLDHASPPLAGVQSPTNVIILLNAAAFILMGLLGAGWFTPTDILPYVLYGANNGAATTDGGWWRLLTSMFLHYGLLHLLFNMWALFQVGHFLERLLGRDLFILTYLGSGLAGGFASILWHGDQTWSAGASGAVFGVYGALFGYMLRQKQTLPRTLYQSLFNSSLVFASYNLVYGLARAGIDNAAHLGGLVGGLGLGWLLALPVDAAVRRTQTGRRQRLGLAALGLLVIAGVTLTPRFDYNSRDAVLLEFKNEPFAEREAPLFEHHRKSLSGLLTTTDHAAYADWLETELIPFYQGWDDAIASLELKPDRPTSRTRDQMRAIFQLQISSYRHLLTGLRTGEDDAFGLYVEENNRVSELIDQLHATPAP